MLAKLVGGVNFNGQIIWERPFDNGAIANWSVNGGRASTNEFLLDGAPNNSQAGSNNIAYVPPVDSVQEFKIQTNSYDSQYGHTGGGIINVSLKSGTNQLHGTVYNSRDGKAGMPIHSRTMHSACQRTLTTSISSAGRSKGRS